MAFPEHNPLKKKKKKNVYLHCVGLGLSERRLFIGKVVHLVIGELTVTRGNPETKKIAWSPPPLTLIPVAQR